MRKITKGKVVLVYTKTHGANNEDIISLFEDTFSFFEYNFNAHRNSLPYGVAHIYNIYLPKRVLKKYYEIRNVVANLNYFCEHDVRLGERLAADMQAELMRIWDRYTKPTWFRTKPTMYEIPLELPF